MEANFMLRTQKQLCPFHGELNARRVWSFFKFWDEHFVPCIYLIVGGAFEGIKHRYKTRMDVYSLVMARGLECGDDTGTMRRAMEALVLSKYLGELDSLLEWAVPRVGFHIGEGVQTEGEGLKEVIIPFLR
ncbi:hypothetical protein SUGI_0615760 [Cryptomeria japonica]|nr:hypothetical protein SUGI_0615760 [Cryptomeria japonica]